MVLFFLMYANAFSQHIIKGKVIEDIDNEPIPYVSILIKNVKNAYLINFTSTDEEGNFSIELTKALDSVLIETSIISHLPKSELLIFDKTKKNYAINFRLQQRLTVLEEVYIEGKKPKITVKIDTTLYNVNQFKDGSEHVVEDLLKNLPGISVGDNGAIKFKGKQVTRVLLDGDNIFNENYTIGTKNIDFEIIEEVQAIEDYNTNPLLKGIKSSDDVAINLILKKGKTDISGNAEIGLGLEHKKLMKANTISVSKKLKGFSTISYNNIGENYSPHNFTSNIVELSKINESNQRTNDLVNSSGFNSNLPNNRISVNNNFFGSINALYKINEKLSFRANRNFFKDKLKRDELYNTTYKFENQELNISNQENSIKKPLINTFEYDLIYNINKKSLLTSTGKWDSQSIKKSAIGFNNEINFENITKSKDVFLKNDIEYTYRINNKNVLQFFGSLSSNDVPQNVDVLFENDALKQTIDFKKNYFKLQSSLISKAKKSEYELDLGYNFIENIIDSELQGLDNSNQYFTNDIYYKPTEIYANFVYRYRMDKWRFTTKLYNSLFNVKLNDLNLQTNYKESFVSVRPTFSVNYYFNKESFLYLDYALSNQLADADKVFSGLILTNNRTLSNNDFSFNLFNSQASTLGYRINDFYNLFQFNAYAKYGFKKYDYINELNVDELTNFYTSIVDVTNNKSLDFALDFEKYIHFFRSTINVNSLYSIYNYRNIINDSELRDNKSKSFFGQFHVQTGFQGHLNFENKVLFRNNVYTTSSNTSNSFTSFQNDFKIKYIKDYFQFVLNSQYFKPDLDQSTSGYLFLDAFLSYKTKNGKIEYQIKANNLLNKKVYININTSDYSTSIFEHNLQERFILFSILFKY